MLFPVLIKEWGRIGRKKAKKLFVFTSSRLACREWDYTIKKRLQHGYRVLKKTNKD
jgi:predicted DNA-binding WGR domain protein